MTSDPTAGEGLGIHPDPPEKPRDVFDFVLRSYKKGKENSIEVDEHLQAFVDHARELFSENRAIAQDTMSETLALRFQDGSVLTFCDVPSGMQGVGGEPGAMQVAREHPQRGADGKGKTVPSPRWGVSSEQGTS